MPITIESAVAALANVVHPETKRPLGDVDLVRDGAVTGDAVSLSVDLATPGDPQKPAIESAIGAALKGAGASGVTIAWGARKTTRTILADDPCPGVANILLVMSGKGGVGK